MMKKIFSILTGLFLTLVAYSQAPDAFSYQAVLRDATGQINTNAGVSIEISILKGSITGTVVFSETHSTTTDEFGIVNLAIGSENPDDFALIDWANGPYFIKVAVDGTVYGTTPLLSVPYAKYAGAAGNTFSGSFNDLSDVPANLDTNYGDDFDGDYGSLANLPDWSDSLLAHTPDLSGFLTSEVDSSTTNELQMLSISGDTIFLTGGGFVKLPEGAAVSFNDLINVPSNLDTDASDDFDGDYGSLSNLPNWSDSLNAHTPDLTGYDSNAGDDFSGNYNDLTDAPNIADSISTHGFSGSYNDLIDAPNIADSISTNGFSGSFDDLVDVPSNLDTDASDDFDGDYGSLSNAPDWSDSLVAHEPDLTGYDSDVSDDFSGNYNDLSNTPDIADSISAHGFSGSYPDLTEKPALWDSTYASIKNTPDLSPYATKDMGGEKITNLADPAGNQDAATKAYIDELIENVRIEAELYTIDDINGNTYPLVKIGGKIWTKKNLMTSRLNDGTPILDGSDNWDTILVSPDYRWYDDDSAAYAQTYGALYNWNSVNSGKLCPAGWHVPTDGEWKEIEQALGMSQLSANTTGDRGTDQGSKLAGNEALWTDGNIDNNAEFGSSGFTALPGGAVDYYGTFNSVGDAGIWWSATDSTASQSYVRILSYVNTTVYRNVLPKKYGLSVRCVKDE